MSYGYFSEFGGRAPSAQIHFVELKAAPALVVPAWVREMSLGEGGRLALLFSHGAGNFCRHV